MVLMSHREPPLVKNLRRLLLAFFLVGACGCSRSLDPEALLPGAVTLDPSWVPLHWIGDDVVLFNDQDSFFTYDLRKKSAGPRVKSGRISINCVDLDNGVVHFARLKERNGSTNYEHGAYWDSKALSLGQLPEDESAWSGEFNCRRHFNYKAKEKRQKHEKLQKEYLGETWQTASDYHYTFTNLLRDTHGSLFLLDKPNGVNETSRLLYLERGGKGSFYPVANSRFRIKYGIAFDAAAKKYLLYQQASDFEKLKGPWPLTAYLFSLEDDNFRELSVPPGPWVVEYGFLDQLHGFSCGISCYTHMKLFLVGGRMLISVWGKLVGAQARGLYALRDGKWVLLMRYAGEEAPALVSGNDGCRVVVHQAKRTLAADLCRTSKP